MPLFEYVAVNNNGKNVKGSIDAESPRAARQKLRGQGYFPTEVTEASIKSTQKTKDIRKLFQSEKVSLRELSIATRQLATLVGAGLPLVSALGALADQTES